MYIYYTYIHIYQVEIKESLYSPVMTCYCQKISNVKKSEITLSGFILQDLKNAEKFDV